MPVVGGQIPVYVTQRLYTLRKFPVLLVVVLVLILKFFQK